MTTDGGSNITIRNDRLEWNLHRYTNVPSKVDVWILYGLYLLDEEGNKKYGGESITLPYSVWEMAILVPGNDYFGGVHGSEEYSSVSIVVGEDSVSVTSNDTFTGLGVKFSQTTDLYEPGTSNIWATSTRDTYWYHDKISVVNTIDWLHDINTTQAYVGLFPIRRKLDDNTQISDTAVFSPGGEIEDVSEEGHPQNLIDPATAVRIYNQSGVVDFTLTQEFTGCTINNMFISPVDAYNKVYTNFDGNITNGDTWVITTTYQFNLN